HLETSPAKLPKRMAAQKVVLFPVFEPGDKLIAAGSADFSMMIKHPIRERARIPAFQARRRHRHPVDPASLDGHISANIFETGFPEELAAAIDMVDIHITVVI